MRDRIRPPKDLEPVLDSLKNDGFFETKQKALMFAAAVGYAIERKKETQGQPLEAYGEGIRLEYFERPWDARFIDLVAIAVKADLQVLVDSSQPWRIELFERFAHSGLMEIDRLCYTGSQDPMLGLLGIIDRMAYEERTDALPGLDAERQEVEKLL